MHIQQVPIQSTRSWAHWRRLLYPHLLRESWGAQLQEPLQWRLNWAPGIGPFRQEQGSHHIPWALILQRCVISTCIFLFVFSTVDSRYQELLPTKIAGQWCWGMSQRNFRPWLTASWTFLTNAGMVLQSVSCSKEEEQSNSKTWPSFSMALKMCSRGIFPCLCVGWTKGFEVARENPCWYSSCSWAGKSQRRPESQLRTPGLCGTQDALNSSSYVTFTFVSIWGLFKVQSTTHFSSFLDQWNSLTASISLPSLNWPRFLILLSSVLAIHMFLESFCFFTVL